MVDMLILSITMPRFGQQVNFMEFNAIYVIVARSPRIITERSRLVSPAQQGHWYGFSFVGAGMSCLFRLLTAFHTCSSYSPAYWE